MRFAGKCLQILLEYGRDFFAALAEYACNAWGAGSFIVPDDAVVCAGVLVSDDCAAAEKTKATRKDDFGAEGGG